jgi:predicted kinase
MALPRPTGTIQQTAEIPMPDLPPILIIFAGLPGSGKTTLARLTATHLRLPVFSKDRVQRVLRDHNLAAENTGDGYYIILDQADEQLALGVSVILDATFPLDHFRLVASETAARHQARFCAIYCTCSDDAVWQARMENRVHYIPGWKPVGWDDVLRMRRYYQPWGANALTVDSLLRPQHNIERVLAAIHNAGRSHYTPHQPYDPRLNP